MNRKGAAEAAPFLFWQGWAHGRFERDAVVCRIQSRGRPRMVVQLSREWNIRKILLDSYTDKGSVESSLLGEARKAVFAALATTLAACTALSPSTTSRLSTSMVKEVLI